MMRTALALLALIAFAHTPVFAQTASLVDKEKLAGLTANPSGYQLVDARSEAQRRARKLPLSSHYAPGMKPKAPLLIVVADDDAAALGVARALAKATGRLSFALKGGLDAWMQMAKEPAPANLAPTFVIPRNTCESGSTLQEYKK